MGRARMACWRCECGRRCARRVTQAVGVMQHSAFRGTLGRQELVGKVVVWGRGSGRRQECGLCWFCCVASRNLWFWRYAESVGGCCLTSSGVWECEADGSSCGTFMLRTPEQPVFLERPHRRGTSALPDVCRSGRKGVVPRRLSVVWGGQMAQKVRLEKPGFTSCYGGEGGGWLSNNQKDGRELQVWFGRGELSGSGSAFGSCSSQGLPVRCRSASHWRRVRMRRGEAQRD